MNINIDELLLALLESKLPKSKRMRLGDIPIYTPPGAGGGITIPAPGGPPDPNQIIDLPYASSELISLRIDSSELLLNATPTIVDIPVKDGIKEIEYDNPFNTTQNYTLEVETDVVEGWSMTITKKITSTKKIGGKLSFKIGPQAGTNVGGEASFEKSVEESITNANTIDKTKRERRTEKLVINIPPKVRAKILSIAQNYEARRSYTGWLIVDGDITLTAINPLVKDTMSIKTFLTDDERKINLSGYYSNVTWDKLKVDIDVLEEYK